MGQVLDGSATTTHAVRAAIQRSKASIQELSERYGITPKTVVKWRKRGFVGDAPMGPKERRSTVLSAQEEVLARLAQAYAAGARRPPLRAPGDHPPSDPLQSAPLVPAPRHQPTLGSERLLLRQRVNQIPEEGRCGQSVFPIRLSSKALKAAVLLRPLMAV